MLRTAISGYLLRTLSWKKLNAAVRRVGGDVVRFCCAVLSAVSAFTRAAAVLLGIRNEVVASAAAVPAVDRRWRELLNWIYTRCGLAAKQRAAD